MSFTSANISDPGSNPSQSLSAATAAPVGHFDAVIVVIDISKHICSRISRSSIISEHLTVEFFGHKT